MTHGALDDHQGCRGLRVGMVIASYCCMEKTEIDLNGFTGWVTREGKLIACDSFEHMDAAIGAGQEDPYRAGWIHYWRGDPEPTYKYTITTKQMDLVIAIAAASGLRLEVWFEDMGIIDGH